MITFNQTMDQKSMDVFFNEKLIGSINWHTTMCFVPFKLHETTNYLQQEELESIVNKMKEIKANGFKAI